MLTTYELTALRLDCTTSVAITQLEFENIVKAVDGLTEVFSIEELYDAVMQNYRIYEEGQLHITLSHALRSSPGPDALDDARRTSGLHLSNLLSSARAFLDVTPKLLKAIGGETLKASFERFTSEIYDRSPGYRFMEALRNYTQHRGGSVSSMTFDSRKSSPPSLEEGFKLLYSIEPAFHVEPAEREFKSKIRPLLHDLKNTKGLISVTPLVREYLVGLNAIILQLRALLKPVEVAFYTINDDAVARLEAVGIEGVFLAATKLEDGKPTEKFYLAQTRSARTERLRSRNGNISHLPRMQLTS